MKKQKEKPKYKVTVSFETEADAREFALKVMEIPSPKWAQGISTVREDYPR